jgi:hypothetical protein
MTRKHATRQRPATHFEQVPLSAIKEHARSAVAEDRSGKVGLATEPEQRKTAPPSRFHAVQFYGNPAALCRIVASFIGEGLARGAAAALMVTPDHAKRIDACLGQDGFDVDALKRDGALVVLDARDTLNQFMMAGTPNPGAFRRTVGGLLTEMRRGQRDRGIRAYGEMVDLLWKDGREGAAIRLETLWNQLATSREFDLLCGYAMGNFYKGPALDAITRQHTHVVPTDGGTPVPTAHAVGGERS